MNYEFSGEFGEMRPSMVGPIRHSGKDIPTPQSGGLYAMLRGRVESVTQDPLGYGNNVLIRKGRELFRFAHLQSANVQEGDLVNPDTLLGTTGCSGMCTGPHVHFERIIDTGHGWVYTTPPDQDVQVSAPIGQGFPIGLPNLIPPIPNPWKLFSGGVDAVGDFFEFMGNLAGLLASPRLWIRLAATLVAIIFLLYGLNALSGAVTGMKVTQMMGGR